MRCVRFVGLLLAVVGMGACGPGQAPDASDEAISQRVVEYFRKVETTPGLEFRVIRLRDSEVPGFREGDVVVSLGEQTQTIPFHVRRDGRYFFRGGVADISIDPLQAVMSKISLAGQPGRGPENAKVTVVEYSDFECPYCARVYFTLEQEVLGAYTDKIRFVFKNFPLASIHPWAEDGAVAAECAFLQGNDHFWAMYRGLFERQPAITPENLRQNATEVAGEAGMNVAAFQGCFDQRQTLAAVRADASEASALGVNGTPTFFVNGRRVSGNLDAAGFKQLFDDALAKTG